jgi:hypothetical protein
MTIARVSMQEVDGQLGAVNSEALPLAIAGTAAAGAYTPRVFARLADMIAEYHSGDLLEAAAPQLKDWTGQVIACRIQVAADATTSLVTTAWLGTSPPTVATGDAPSETAEYRIRIGEGGTRGTEGITYQVSLDAGRNYGAMTALGTATTITLPAATVGTLAIDFGAGTMLTGNVLVIRTVAAVPTAAEVTTAATALGQHVQRWECLEVSSPCDATIASAVDAVLTEMAGRGKKTYAILHPRLQTPGETLAAYQTAMASMWGSYSSTRTHIWPGDMHYVSRVDGRKMRRPRSWAVAPYIERLPRQIDPAHIDNGALPGVSLVDDLGNPELHDEKISPAFDAMKLGSLYSRGTDGVYIGNARTKSPEGSDYRYVQIRRVINVGEWVLEEYLNRVLNKDVIVAKKTGKPTPSYVRRVKGLAESRILSVYSVGPMVSGIDVNPDANANILSTEQWPFDFEVIPLGYVKSIPVRVLMRNPALTVV